MKFSKFLFQVYTFNERIKLSRDELQTGMFIINNRNIDFGSDPMKTCQDLHCDTVGKEAKNKEKIIQLLIYLNQRDILKDFIEWIPPRFPVNGLRVVERGVKKGPKLALVLHELRQVWKHSGYTKNEDELLEHLEEVLDLLAERKAERDKAKASQEKL
jgi:hypothetical protein